MKREFWSIYEKDNFLPNNVQIERNVANDSDSSDSLCVFFFNSLTPDKHHHLKKGTVIGKLSKRTRR